MSGPTLNARQCAELSNAHALGVRARFLGEPWGEVEGFYRREMSRLWKRHRTIRAAREAAGYLVGMLDGTALPEGAGAFDTYMGALRGAKFWAYTSLAERARASYVG